MHHSISVNGTNVCGGAPGTLDSLFEALTLEGRSAEAVTKAMVELELRYMASLETGAKLLAGAEVELLAGGEAIRQGKIPSHADLLRFEVTVGLDHGMDVPEGWLVFTSTRPLLGHKTVSDAPFFRGRFRAAIDPTDSLAAMYLNENRKLAANAVVTGSREELLAMTLFDSRYLDQYLTEFAGEELWKVLQHQIDDLSKLGYAKALWLKRTALADADLMAKVTAALKGEPLPSAQTEQAASTPVSARPADTQVASQNEPASNIGQAIPAEDALPVPVGLIEASPGGLMAGKDPLAGGFIDFAIASGEWFVIFNDESLKQVEGLKSRNDAIRVFNEAISARNAQGLNSQSQSVPEINLDQSGLSSDSGDDDLSYRDQGLFTTFLPNTPAGETAWRELASKNDGVGKVLTAHLEDTLAQLRAAGYSVTKSSVDTGVDDDALLEELGAEQAPLEAPTAYDAQARKSAIVTALSGSGWSAGDYPSKGDMALRFERVTGDADTWSAPPVIGMTIQVIKGAGAVVGASLSDDPTQSPQAIAEKIESLAAGAQTLATVAAEGKSSAVSGPEPGSLVLVEHQTAKRLLTGVVRTDLTAAQAKEIDPYSFKKDGGYFIREKHVDPALIASVSATTAGGAELSEPEPKQDVSSLIDAVKKRLMGVKIVRDNKMLPEAARRDAGDELLKLEAELRDLNAQAEAEVETRIASLRGDVEQGDSESQGGMPDVSVTGGDQILAGEDNAESDLLKKIGRVKRKMIANKNIRLNQALPEAERVSASEKERELEIELRGLRRLATAEMAVSPDSAAKEEAGDAVGTDSADQVVEGGSASQLLSAAEYDELVAGYGEVYAQGYNANRRGYSIETPVNVRSRADKEAYADGWLKSKSVLEAQAAFAAFYSPEGGLIGTGPFASMNARFRAAIGFVDDMVHIRSGDGAMIGLVAGDEFEDFIAGDAAKLKPVDNWTNTFSKELMLRLELVPLSMRKMLSSEEQAAIEKKEGEAYVLGYQSYVRGHGLQLEENVKKQADKEAFSEGWSESKRVSLAALSAVIAADQPQEALAAATELEKLPLAVRSRLDWALKILKEAKRSFESAERSRGLNSVGLEHVKKEHQEDVYRAYDRLGAIRELAPRNGVDFDVALAELGGIPDLSRYGFDSSTDPEAAAVVQENAETAFAPPELMSVVRFEPNASVELVDRVTGTVIGVDKTSVGDYRLRILYWGESFGGRDTLRVIPRDGGVEFLGMRQEDGSTEWEDGKSLEDDNGGNLRFDQMIAIAADSMQRLRKPDVYRVLDQAQSPDSLMALGEYIARQREDLVEEIADCVREISAENKWAIAGDEPKGPEWADYVFAQTIEHEYGPGKGITEAVKAATNGIAGTVVLETTARPSGRLWHVVYVSMGDGQYESVPLGTKLPEAIAEQVTVAQRKHVEKAEHAADAAARYGKEVSQERAVAAANSFIAGRKLGSITPNTGKVLRAAFIAKDHGNGSFDVEGIAGATTAVIRNIQASSILSAIERSAEKAGQKVSAGAANSAEQGQGDPHSMGGLFDAELPVSSAATAAPAGADVQSEAWRTTLSKARKKANEYGLPTKGCALDKITSLIEQYENPPLLANGLKIGEGEVFLTITGRKTSPFPAVNTGSTRGANKTMKESQRWIVQNALDEAVGRDDDHAALMFRAAIDSPQEADLQMAIIYLTDRDSINAPQPKFLKAMGTAGAEPLSRVPAHQQATWANGDEDTAVTDDAPETASQETNKDFAHKLKACWDDSVKSTFIIGKCYPAVFLHNGVERRLALWKDSGAGPIKMMMPTEQKMGLEMTHFAMDKNGEITRIGSKNLWALAPESQEIILDEFNAVFDGDGVAASQEEASVHSKPRSIALG